MTQYVALLRGINVGGKNIVKMADLKRMLEGLGLQFVQTYIQSGNVVFRSDKAEEALRKTIEQQFASVFGFPVIVVLRTVTELNQMIRHCPFSKEAIAAAEEAAAAESLYVALLLQAPAAESVECLNSYRSKNDDFCILGRDVYLLFQHSIRDSKLANNLSKLAVPMTVRNWKTVTKLTQLAATAEDK